MKNSRPVGLLYAMEGGVSIDFGKCANKANFATQSGKTGGKNIGIIRGV